MPIAQCYSSTSNILVILLLSRVSNSLSGMLNRGSHLLSLILTVWSSGQLRMPLKTACSIGAREADSLIRTD